VTQDLRQLEHDADIVSSYAMIRAVNHHAAFATQQSGANLASNDEVISQLDTILEPAQSLTCQGMEPADAPMGASQYARAMQGLVPLVHDILDHSSPHNSAGGGARDFTDEQGPVARLFDFSSSLRRLRGLSARRSGKRSTTLSTTAPSTSTTTALGIDPQAGVRPAKQPKQTSYPAAGALASETFAERAEEQNGPMTQLASATSLPVNEVATQTSLSEELSSSDPVAIPTTLQTISMSRRPKAGRRRRAFSQENGRRIASKAIKPRMATTGRSTAASSHYEGVEESTTRLVPRNDASGCAPECQSQHEGLQSSEAAQQHIQQAQSSEVDQPHSTKLLTVDVHLDSQFVSTEYTSSATDKTNPSQQDVQNSVDSPTNTLTMSHFYTRDLIMPKAVHRHSQAVHREGIVGNELDDDQFDPRSREDCDIVSGVSPYSDQTLENSVDPARTSQSAKPFVNSHTHLAGDTDDIFFDREELQAVSPLSPLQMAQHFGGANAKFPLLDNQEISSTDSMSTGNSKAASMQSIMSHHHDSDGLIELDVTHGSEGHEVHESEPLAAILEAVEDIAIERHISHKEDLDLHRSTGLSTAALYLKESAVDCQPSNNLHLAEEVTKSAEDPSVDAVKLPSQVGLTQEQEQHPSHTPAQRAGAFSDPSSRSASVSESREDPLSSVSNSDQTDSSSSVDTQAAAETLQPPGQEPSSPTAHITTQTLLELPLDQLAALKHIVEARLAALKRS